MLHAVQSDCQALSYQVGLVSTLEGKEGFGSPESADRGELVTLAVGSLVIQLSSILCQ